MTSTLPPHGAFLMRRKECVNVTMTREERIQQIRDCGQNITEKAESIYGDYACPTNLQVVITMKANELPNITVNREFFSDIMVERNGGHVK